MKTDIFLRAFELEDAKFINDLRNIEEFENKIGGTKRFVSLARERKWVEDLIMNDYQDKFYLAICEKETKEIVGYISVSEIDHVNKSCFWSGVKIHPTHNGKGYAKQAALMVIRYVFEELNMERCRGESLEEHAAVVKMMNGLGFKIDGLERHSLYKNGKYHNIYRYSMLSHEYKIIKEKFDL